MKKKILLVISNLEFGGAQRQIVELVNNMDKQQFEVHVCSLSDYIPLADFIDKDIKLHIIKKRYKFDLAVAVKLTRLIKQYDIDLIHGYLFDAEIAARLAGYFAGIKVIGAERNADYTIKKVQHIAYKLTNPMIDLIIANSSRGAEFNSQLINLPMSRYRVVYNGVDTGKFKPADNTGIRAELNIPRDAQVLGMFASFKQQKNHPFLFAAVKEISAKYPDLKLLLVGDMLYAGMHGSDEYYDRIQTQINELGLQHNCIMPGNRNDIERVYPACDFTVLPSLFEGTPNVLLESMACGIPVIATDVSDNKKIVADGETGFIVELGNIPQLATAIDTLLSDKTKLQVFSKNSRKRMEDLFSTRKLAENTQAIYSSLLTQ